MHLQKADVYGRGNMQMSTITFKKVLFRSSLHKSVCVLLRYLYSIISFCKLLGLNYECFALIKFVPNNFVFC